MAKKKAEDQPGREGRFELGERLVDDPYGQGPRYAAPVNVRESAIDHMASRGRIDDTQRAAGDRFRKLWELAAIGRQRGIDFESEGRSVGAVSDPLTDELVRAGRDLKEVMQTLGMVRARILVAIVGEGRLIEEVAKDWARAGGVVTGRRAEGYVSGTLVDSLDDLIMLWRMAAKGNPTRKPGSYLRNGVEVAVSDCIRASGPMTATGPATEILIGDKGEVTVEQKRGLDRGPMTRYIAGTLGTHAPRGKR